MITLQQFRDFDAVITHGGYRAAARALGVSQAGLTKSVARLEAEYGVSLLDRKAGGVALTGEGEAFLRQARAALVEAARAEQCLLDFKSRRCRTVALGMSAEPSLELVPAVLGDFRKRFGDVTVHLHQSVTGELLDAVRENRVEAAVTRLPLGFCDHDLVIDELYTCEPIIVARKGHPLAHATSVHELARCDWVVVGPLDEAGPDDASIQDLFVNRQLDHPPLAAVSESLFSALSLLVTSDCVARLPAAVLQHPMTRGLLTRIPVREASHRCAIAVVRKRSRPLTREMQALLAMLTSYARLTHRTTPQRPAAAAPVAPAALVEA